MAKKCSSLLVLVALLGVAALLLVVGASSSSAVDAKATGRPQTEGERKRALLKPHPAFTGDKIAMAREAGVDIPKLQAKIVAAFRDAWISTRDLVLTVPNRNLVIGEDELVMKKHTHFVPIMCCFLYLFFVFVGPRALGAFKDAFPPLYHMLIVKPLKPILFVWNLGLSLMSLLMVYGSVRYLIYEIGVMHYGGNMLSLVCDPDGKVFAEANPAQWYLLLFGWSKFAELFDTVFLIMKKPERPVMFLNWYHHTTVLAFTWYAGLTRFGTGGSFMIMNAIVHTVMYFYYAIAELGYKPFWGRYITKLQISQMVFGLIFVGIHLYGYLFQRESGRQCYCDYSFELMTCAAVMYFTYLLLFMNFYIRRWLDGPKKASSAEKASETKKKN